MHKLALQHVNASPHVGAGQARPPPKIVEGGGAVAGEVAVGEQRQRFIAAKVPRARCALLDEGVRELLAAPAATAEHRFEFGVQDDMCQAQPFCFDASTGEGSSELGTCELLAAYQRLLQSCPAFRKHGCIELQ